MKTEKKLQKYSPEELAESFVFPLEQTKAEQEADARILKKLREEKADHLPRERRLLFRILQLKFQMEDYIKKADYNVELTFGHFLKEYIEILYSKRKDFARDLDIEPAELSQIINRHRKPKTEIIVRLDIHSANVISARIWLKVLEKEKEFELLNNSQLWEKEKKRVKNGLELSL